MKKIIIHAGLLLLITAGFISCDDDSVKMHCDTRATVKDLRGLDGCGFVFELADGTRLEPSLPAFCGFGAMPLEMSDDPLYGFEWVDGKEVTIAYEPASDMASVCMAGEVVKITCLSELPVSIQEK